MPARSEWFYIQEWRARREQRFRDKCLKHAKFKKGDLVKIASWCKSKERIAHVVDVAWYDINSITIQFLDEEGILEEPSKAVAQNLVLISRDDD